MMTPLRNLHRQRGISFVGLMFVFAVCAVVVLLGLKLVPPYIDYFTVKKMLSAMATSEEVRSGTVGEIRKSFDRRASIDYQTSVTADDLEITKEGGETIVTASWTKKIPLFTGYTLLVEFTASSNDK